MFGAGSRCFIISAIWLFSIDSRSAFGDSLDRSATIKVYDGVTLRDCTYAYKAQVSLAHRSVMRLSEEVVGGSGDLRRLDISLLAPLRLNPDHPDSVSLANARIIAKSSYDSASTAFYTNKLNEYPGGNTYHVHYPDRYGRYTVPSCEGSYEDTSNRLVSVAYRTPVVIYNPLPVEPQIRAIVNNPGFNPPAIGGAHGGQGAAFHLGQDEVHAVLEAAQIFNEANEEQQNPGGHGAQANANINLPAVLQQPAQAPAAGAAVMPVLQNIFSKSINGVR